MENIFICIIATHIRHSTNQMERNCIAHIVVGHIIVTCSITAILLILVIFQDFLFYRRCICLNCNINTSNYLQ